ncbi:MAG: hypothetical protein EA361_18155 [Bacteroidetes bacterium]|nr:MAG: hypothetical protein EA361_18155 [Bacteroidota bacterium]
MINYYHQRIEETEKNIEYLQRRDNYLSMGRLLGFVLLVISLIISISTLKLIPGAVTVLLAIGFVQVVLIHLKNHANLTRENTRKGLLTNEIRGINLEGNNYYSGAAFRDPNHDYTLDMDIFGEKGLFHYINRCATGVGNKALAGWLSDEPTLNTILVRQQAVKELAKKKSWCENLRVELYERRIKDFDAEHLPEIKKTLPPPHNIKIWITASFSILAITLSAIIFAGINASLLLLPVFFNYFFNARMNRFTSTIKIQLEGREKTLIDYHYMLTTLEAEEFSAPYLKNLQEDLLLEKNNATTAIAYLQGLSKKLDYSLNMIVGAILNYFFIWDILTCIKISAWFDKYASKTHLWFEVAGKLEALISLANLENNHPQWNYPEFAENKFELSGKEMGHPLIAEKERVSNSFQWAEGSFITIVTGSNMAGKSTFLRTLGVNIILAQAGAPVCAGKLHISLFRIMTYLTITDSLSENTSTFYREILRLKKILESVREDNNVLLLLDELLRGTNSADKAKGSMAITRELINYKVPAVIATHNLELAEMQKSYPQEITNYYFDIIIDDNNKMKFDYKLKTGVCNTFNASLLLKEIGIDIER